ncbi:hypothetical protein [Clostridium sp.]|jgi:hypothetical protein|uniref:hypothetical protein n=1 Tax=Clostridium sp. TaxID=1506 RepID=UPI0028490853|nr:hypothetical protein [Clostridium sp.]MDR3597493.1 hypothetical protein [Clostridium sp.]
MNDKSKSNSLESFSRSNGLGSFSNVTGANQVNISSNSSQGNNISGDKKNSGCNDWNSVPVTYDKEESTRKHEKTATNNQWCSTSK